MMRDTCDCILRDRIAIFKTNIEFAVRLSNMNKFWYWYVHNLSTPFLIGQLTETANVDQKYGRLLPISVNNFYHTKPKPKTKFSKFDEFKENAENC